MEVRNIAKRISIVCVVLSTICHGVMLQESTDAICPDCIRQQTHTGKAATPQRLSESGGKGEGVQSQGVHLTKQLSAERSGLGVQVCTHL